VTVDRVAGFEADIAASPKAFALLLDDWSFAPRLQDRRVVLTGLGSSLSAARIVATACRRLGASAWAEHPSAAASVPSAGDLALVAISASGRTPEVVAAAERHRGNGLVIAVTNAADGPLAAVADDVVLLRAGHEASGIACRTFRATIAALSLMTGAAGLDALRATVPILERAVAGDSGIQGVVDAGVELLDGASSIDVLAEASLLGLGEQAALMLREAPRLPAHAYESAEWLHTGVYLALPGHRVVLLEGSAADAEVVATVERRGGAVLRIPATQVGADPVGRAIVDSIVAERAAAALWRRAGAVDAAPSAPDADSTGSGRGG
jgi:fructoselysine-6-P-deglycase FrlB-like protein